jgi:hypothetical protein
MRFILMLLLLIAGSPAWAEWVKVSETDDGSSYIDPATIRRIGDVRRVWVLQDLKQSSIGVMSRRALEEFDCKEERRRILTLSSHSGAMASGDVIATDNSPGEWDYLPPNTPGATILGIVCAK